jgi:hypothetical protein
MSDTDTGVLPRELIPLQQDRSSAASMMIAAANLRNRG